MIVYILYAVVSTGQSVSVKTSRRNQPTTTLLVQISPSMENHQHCKSGAIYVEQYLPSKHDACAYINLILFLNYIIVHYCITHEFAVFAPAMHRQPNIPHMDQAQFFSENCKYCPLLKGRGERDLTGQRKANTINKRSWVRVRH